MELQQLSNFLAQQYHLDKYKFQTIPVNNSSSNNIRRKNLRKYSFGSQSRISILSDNILSINKRMKQICKAIMQQNFDKTVKLLFKLSDQYQHNKKFAQSFFILKAVIVLSNYFGNFLVKIEAFIHISNIYKIISQFGNSIKILQRALEYAWLLRNNEYQLLIYDKIGIIYYISGDIEKADYYHNRFAQCQIQDEESIIFRNAIENNRQICRNLIRNRHKQFTIYILEMSNLLTTETNFFKSRNLSQQYIQKHLILQTKESFQRISELFLSSQEFNKQSQIFEQLLIKKTNLSQNKQFNKILNRKLSIFDHIEQVKNHKKVIIKLKQLNQSLKFKKKQSISKLDESTKYEQSQFDDYYQELKRKSRSISNQSNKKVNLPILISHLNKNRYF